VKPTKKQLKTVYYVEDRMGWPLIPRPNEKRLGVSIGEPFQDCWYAIHHQAHCPNEVEGTIPGCSNCPIVVGNNPCKEYAVTVRLCSVPKETHRTKQTTLGGGKV
jgi:hypothetical protein